MQQLPFVLDICFWEMTFKLLNKKILEWDGKNNLNLIVCAANLQFREQSEEIKRTKTNKAKIGSKILYIKVYLKAIFMWGVLPVFCDYFTVIITRAHL